MRSRQTNEGDKAEGWDVVLQAADLLNTQSDPHGWGEN